jgi:hypothetical protein
MGSAATKERLRMGDLPRMPIFRKLQINRERRISLQEHSRGSIA